MSNDKRLCHRCGDEINEYDFDVDSSFWGAIQTEVVTRVARTIRVMGFYFRHNPDYRRPGSVTPPAIQTDEKQALCSGCWDLLIGRFMQGRTIPALPGKETW